MTVVKRKDFFFTMDFSNRNSFRKEPHRTEEIDSTAKTKVIEEQDARCG